jgi:hypothetical protein
MSDNESSGNESPNDIHVTRRRPRRRHSRGRSENMISQHDMQVTMQRMEEYFEEGNEEILTEFISRHPEVLGQVTETMQESPLMLACKYGMPNLAFAILRMGDSHPGKVNVDGDTALLFACKNVLGEVALELVETGDANVGQIGEDGRTALMIACERRLNEVAIAIIKKGGEDANIDFVDNNGENALQLAYETELNDVIALLEKPDITLNLYEHTCFDIINIEEVPVMEFLKRDKNNILIVFFHEATKKPQCIGLHRDDIKLDIDHVLYECRRVNVSPHKDDNTIWNVKYYNLKALLSYGELTYFGSMQMMIRLLNDDPDNRLFFFQRSNKSLETTTSHIIAVNPPLTVSVVSARHCQENQGGIIYNLIHNVNVVTKDENSPEKEDKQIQKMKKAVLNRKKRKGRTYRKRLQRMKRAASTRRNHINDLVDMGIPPPFVTMRGHRSNRNEVPPPFVTMRGHRSNRNEVPPPFVTMREPRADRRTRRRRSSSLSDLRNTETPPPFVTMRDPRHRLERTRSLSPINRNVTVRRPRR